jgi:hypothetical protein
VIKNVMGAPSQALQIMLEMQSQRTSQKRVVKENMFFQTAKCAFLFIFVHFDLSYFQIS